MAPVFLVKTLGGEKIGRSESQDVRKGHIG